MNQLYEPQGKSLINYSTVSSGEFNLPFSSAVVVREGGLKLKLAWYISVF